MSPWQLHRQGGGKHIASRYHYLCPDITASVTVKQRHQHPTMLGRLGRAVSNNVACRGVPWLGWRDTRLYSTDEHAEKLEKAASKGDLAGVLRAVESVGESFDLSGVQSALEKVERCTQDMSVDALKGQLHSNKTFQMLADMAVSTAGRAPPEVLAKTIGVLGRLRFADEQVIDSLARHLMPGIQHLQPNVMHELVDGLKHADHSPSVLLLDEVAQRLTEVEVPPDQANSIKAALQDLGREDSNLPNPDAQQQPERIKYS